MRYELTDGWTLSPVTGPDGGAAIPDLVRAAAPVPATVPGTVHTDLLAAGLIEDPYLDRNEAGLTWLWRTGWVYRTTVDWTPIVWNFRHRERVDLVCEGLDTVAAVELNGVQVARSVNMHRSYRWPVGRLLRPGANRLAVTFSSALAYAERLRDAQGELPIPNTASVHPINFVRKMACNFGWDWGPVLITAGIWRPIALERWRAARLARVRPQVEVDPDDTGRVRVLVDVERDAGHEPVELVASVGGQRTRLVTRAGSAALVLSVPDVRRWWPHGHGEQPLYDLVVELREPGSAPGSGPDQESDQEPDREPLDRWQRRIGFRTVALDTREDAEGSAFTLLVNDRPLFVRGANWIPDDCFPSRVTPQRYCERVAQAVEGNVMLLRVWGGGIYEQDAFYDACDCAGVLVWQDFLFACAAYPEEEPIRSEVLAEARENVARLMPHPSLVLWNGNNESFMGWHEWGWPDRVGTRTWGLGYYTALLPAIVEEVDGTRPYWPGSPYSGSVELPSGRPERGCTHLWDVWNTADYPRYRDYRPRFVSEFGWAAPPAWATLTRAVHDDPLRPDSPGMLAHQKASDGYGKLARGLAPHFAGPARIEDWRIEDWHWLTQLNQARAITTGIEHFRSLRGLCMGAIVWQLNDCWPVTSWAAIDGDGRRKPLWYALRRVYADRLLTLQPDGAGLRLVAVNDGRDDWTGRVRVRRMHVGGRVLAEAGFSLDAAADSVWAVGLPEPLARFSEQAGEFQPWLRQPLETRFAVQDQFLVADADGLRAVWFPAEDCAVGYPAPRYGVTVEGEQVTVTAHSLLRDLTVFADRLHPDAVVDEQLVTLLPGERHTFRITGAGPLEASALVPPVLRTAAS